MSILSHTQSSSEDEELETLNDARGGAPDLDRRRRREWRLFRCTVWNRIFLLACSVGLFVDPLFFYALSINESCMCLFIDGWFALTVTLLRCMTDALHLCNLWLMGGDAARSKRGFLFYLFVILPLPQIILWVGIPKLVEKGSTPVVMTVLLIIFVFQYLPKIYHSVCLLRRMQNLSGYIFGTVWWGIALNLIAYFVASHAVGACWYLLGIQRAARCLKEHCMMTESCNIKLLGCQQSIYYGTRDFIRDRSRLLWGDNKIARSTCLDNYDNFDYGVYKWTVQLVTNNNRLEKILFPIFWGLMTLSMFWSLFEY